MERSGIRAVGQTRDFGMSCIVTLSTTGERFSVETGETILQAAQRQGISLPYG